MAGPITLNEAMRGLFVAWRLFLWDRRAIALIDDSRGGALRSFWCAVLVLPLVFARWGLQAATPSDVPGNFGVLVAEAGLARTVTVLAIVYVIGWTAWPVIMYRLAPFLDRGGYYFRYLAARNWSAAMVAVLAVLFAIVDFSGILAPPALKVVSLGFMTVLWAYHWFILRAALELNGGIAAALVAADFGLSVVIGAIGDAVTV